MSGNVSPIENRPAQSGDHDALLRALLEHNSHRWLSAAYAACGDRHLAEDALNEALLCLVSVWRSGETIANPGAWVLQAVHRRAVDRLRKECSQRRLIHEIARMASGEAHAPTIAMTDADKERVQDMIRPLSGRQREVVQLRVLEGVGHREIAARLGCAESRIRAVLAEALKIMHDGEQG